MSFRRLLALGFAGVVISGCADSQKTAPPAGADPVLAARTQLIAGLETCNETHSYDPASTANLGETELGANELAWRQCAYDALRGYSNPDPAVRRQIEALIVEDIAMTAALQQGTMTRSQRRARNLAQIETIKALEEAQARSAAATQVQHDEQVRQVVDGLRGFAR